MIILIGQTEKHEFTITNENGAVDLTGSTARITIVDRAGELIYTESKTSFEAPTTGVVTFIIPRDVTDDFEAQTIKAQIDILNTSDEKDYSETYNGKVIETLAI